MSRPAGREERAGGAPRLRYVDNLEAWSLNEVTVNGNSAPARVSAFAADVAGRP
ncbi:hypothetical protein ACFRR7_26190 [Streptomyces sp. NPDC056909]|uniref:hypothetical protein n=1 Tax=Streptomyces sp. NPDC056909 TaxID=3345963 RepID=UPI0036935AB4